VELTTHPCLAPRLDRVELNLSSPCLGRHGRSTLRHGTVCVQGLQLTACYVPTGLLGQSNKSHCHIPEDLNPQLYHRCENLKCRMTMGSAQTEVNINVG